jgi:hypothetical protein
MLSMKIFALRFLFCAFMATAISVSAAAQMIAGTITVLRADGSVSRIAADGTTTTLKATDTLQESDTVATGNGASAILLFSNGSTIKLGADSRLKIEEFQQDPFSDVQRVSEIKQEPSRSRTSLNLSYGELVGDVKKLNGASQYSIKTPVGAAGIRGTIYRIVFRPTSDGKAFFTVQTAEGQVVMEGVTPNLIPVDAGAEVVVEIDTATNGEPKVVTSALSPATVALIQTEARAIITAVENSTIPPTSNQGTEGNQSQQPPNDSEIEPPAEVPPPPPLTPEAGK